MKKCPYCAEDIQDEARLCRYCGKDLSKPATKRVPDVIWGGLIGLGISFLTVITRSNELSAAFYLAQYPPLDQLANNYILALVIGALVNFSIWCGLGTLAALFSRKILGDNANFWGRAAIVAFIVGGVIFVLFLGDILLLNSKSSTNITATDEPTIQIVDCESGCSSYTSGCPIKATHDGGGNRWYLLPTDVDYTKYPGELFFCTEEDARGKGWVAYDPKRVENQLFDWGWLEKMSTRCVKDKNTLVYSGPGNDYSVILHTLEKTCNRVMQYSPDNQWARIDKGWIPVKDLEGN